MLGTVNSAYMIMMRYEPINHSFYYSGLFDDVNQH